MLFDIGIAGPIAGFLVAVPALFIGLALSHVVRLPDPIHRWQCRSASRCCSSCASWLLWGTPPDGYSLNLHPIAFAAWFGLLATALNLFPIGQLDGGHISYAVLGRAVVVRHAASWSASRSSWPSSRRAGSSGPC